MQKIKNGNKSSAHDDDDDDCYIDFDVFSWVSVRQKQQQQRDEQTMQTLQLAGALPSRKIIPFLFSLCSPILLLRGKGSIRRNSSSHRIVFISCLCLYLSAAEWLANGAAVDRHNWIIFRLWGGLHYTLIKVKRLLCNNNKNKTGRGEERRHPIVESSQRIKRKEEGDQSSNAPPLPTPLLLLLLLTMRSVDWTHYLITVLYNKKKKKNKKDGLRIK